MWHSLGALPKSPRHRLSPRLHLAGWLPLHLRHRRPWFLVRASRMSTHRWLLSMAPALACAWRLRLSVHRVPMATWNASQNVDRISLTRR